MPSLAGAAVARALPPRRAVELSRAAGPPTEGEGDRAWGHFTRRQSTAFMFMREHVPAVRVLEKGSWACLQAIAAHWQAGRSDAYPGQERLAMLTGYNVQSIRGFTRVLEASCFLDVVRERLADGTARLYYGPGPALLAAVAQFDAKYSDERAHLREAVPLDARRSEPVGARPYVAGGGMGQRRVAERAGGKRHPHLSEQAAVASGGHAAMAAGELPELGELKNHSSFLRVAPEKLGGVEEQQGLKISETDREIAFEVLAMLRERRFGRGARLFEANVVAMVATCVSVVDGDRDAKKRAQLDAIEHAFSVSRGTPTPSYIWGSIDHFLEHEAGGRKARLEHERVWARRAHAADGERERARARLRRAPDVCGMPPEVLKFVAELGCGKRSSTAAVGRGP